MKYIFETKDENEAMRVFKGLDMALALFDISRVMLKSLDRQEEEGDINANDVRRRVFDILEKYAIDIDELVE